MPDPFRQSISATQSPALFDASPYLTKWLLWQWFKGLDVETDVTPRMRAGKQLQPIVIDDARRQLQLEVTPNFADEYVRNGPLGCTIDATVYDPQRGRGVLETKCVFDHFIWKNEWHNGQTVPRHIEIQVQHQMVVGNGKTPFEWGVIAPWVCGELQDCIPRQRDQAFEKTLTDEAAKFMASVKSGDEPDPFGTAAEAPLLRLLIAPVPNMTADLRDHAKANDWASAAAAFSRHREQASFHDKAREEARHQLFLAMRAAEGASTVILPGATLKITQRKIPPHERKASTQTLIRVELGSGPAPIDQPFTTLMPPV